MKLKRALIFSFPSNIVPSNASKERCILRYSDMSVTKLGPCTIPNMNFGLHKLFSEVPANFI